jgi:SAM-dependent methyltransferase
LRLGQAFADAAVAALYRYRAPYPLRVLEILNGLIVEPRVVLDAGAGTGAIARALAPTVNRVDALDPSAAMIAEGRRLSGGDDARIRWILGHAEDTALALPYGLIVTGASLHWMREDIVLPRFRDALAPGARLAIVDTESAHSGEWRSEFLEVIRRYSPVEHHVETDEMVAVLAQSGRLVLEGEERTAPMPFDQSVDDYLRLLSSTSTLSRATLGARADSFEAECRAVFNRYAMRQIRSHVVGYVAWGRPA